MHTKLFRAIMDRVSSVRVRVIVRLAVDWRK